MRSDREATRRWLNDIGHHIAMAEGFVAGMSYESFKDDYLHLYAVIRCLEIISEASRRLPDELKARHPSVAWKNMTGAGNVYRHDYEDVAASFVWVVLQDHLPPLRAAIEQELAALGDPRDTAMLEARATAIASPPR
jgi:uncharacterized protein with HEPN domain